MFTVKKYEICGLKLKLPDYWKNSVKNCLFYRASASTLFLISTTYEKIKIQFVFKKDLYLINTKEPSVFDLM